MDIQPAELRAFLALADHLHFGRAADQLHLTQPALSKQIQRLEHKVGGPLVVRRYRDVRLTAAGQVLVARARPLLRDAATTIEAAQRAARGQLGTLRIGFGIATLLELLPNVLQRFRAAYPDVELRMRDMSTPGQLRALVRGDLDIGFVRLPVDDPRIAARPILHERLVLALGPKAPGVRAWGSLRWRTSRSSRSRGRPRPASTITSSPSVVRPGSRPTSFRRRASCSRC